MILSLDAFIFCCLPQVFIICFLDPHVNLNSAPVLGVLHQAIHGPTARNRAPLRPPMADNPSLWTHYHVVHIANAGRKEDQNWWHKINKRFAKLLKYDTRDVAIVEFV